MADFPVMIERDACIQQLTNPPAIIWQTACPLAGPYSGNGWQQVPQQPGATYRPPTPPPSPPTPPSNPPPSSPPSKGCQK